ncbi:hypothetical protein J6590_012176 [Homalodisca vitripennis]|nr:hypothetical protein J6590_012176 [Homalodisca vitripennis]
MRPISLRCQQFYKLPNSPPLSKLLKMAYRSLAGQSKSSFLLLVTHSTQQILLKDTDSVKMLPQEPEKDKSEPSASVTNLSIRASSIFSLCSWESVMLGYSFKANSILKRRSRSIRCWFILDLSRLFNNISLVSTGECRSKYQI